MFPKSCDLQSVHFPPLPPSAVCLLPSHIPRLERLYKYERQKNDFYLELFHFQWSLVCISPFGGFPIPRHTQSHNGANPRAAAAQCQIRKDPGGAHGQVGGAVEEEDQGGAEGAHLDNLDRDFRVYYRRRTDLRGHLALPAVRTIFYNKRERVGRVWEGSVARHLLRGVEREPAPGEKEGEGGGFSVPSARKRYYPDEVHGCCHSGICMRGFFSRVK